MNITTIDKDVNRIISLLNSGNKKAVKNMLITFTPFYIAKMYSKLDPFDKKLWDNMKF